MGVLDAIEDLLSAENFDVDRAAIEAGLAMLRVGGDFADGVIVYEGRRMGGETFVSFDRKAVAVLMEQGFGAVLLG